MTFGGVSYLGIILAAVAGWLVGAVWYTVFGRVWQEAAGVSAAKMKKAQNEPGFYLPFVLAFLAQIVMAWVLAGLVAHLGPGQFTVRNAVISGAFVWLGFVMTTLIVNNSFAGRDRRLLLIDGGHWLLVLLVMGVVLGLLAPG
ncbi:MAG TPA: DUF1761 domain-containing protein [Xanthobacteraceae bacterium]|nr:DUF1761 domain-containing protein [Xanthobacteraceae bacterium]